jgi:hypothetical protein
MDGALAPEKWQRGRFGEVIDYCMKDVFLTARLVSMLPELIDPNTGMPFLVATPWPVRADLQLVLEDAGA